MSGVLVLNAGYEPLHRVSIPHAIRMLVRQVAVVEEAVDGKQVGPYPLPRVLRLVRYVVLKFRAAVPRWSRNRLMERDHYKCAYCGLPASTVDHIMPSSRGGESSWLNTVAACRDCNNLKDNLTPQEAGMRLRFEPFEPTWWQVGASREV